jgi:aromatic-L-amino-acid decarboxylase
MAREFANKVDGEPDWERVAPVPFSTVVLRYAPKETTGAEQDDLNRAIMDRINREGEFFLSHTVLDGRFCLRVALGNLRTEWHHVDRLWESLRAAGSATP